MLRQSHLEQDVDLLLVEPGLVRRLHGGPRPAAAALHLAALHGKVDVVTAGVAGYDLEFGAEHAVGYFGKLKRIGRGAAGADDQLLREHVLPFGDAGRVPGDADADLVVGRTDPTELRRVELRALAAEQLVEPDAAVENPE